MELCKKLLIYPLAIASLYTSPTEAYSRRNYDGLSIETVRGNHHRHGKCGGKNQIYLDTLQVKNQKDSLEKLMADKETYCLNDPYKKHECKKGIHLNVNKIKNQKDSLEKLTTNQGKCYQGQRYNGSSALLIDNLAGKIAFGFIVTSGLFLIGGMLREIIKDWGKIDIP